VLKVLISAADHTVEIERVDQRSEKRDVAGADLESFNQTGGRSLPGQRQHFRIPPRCAVLPQND